MFTYLYDIAFPAIGEFLGIMRSIAISTPEFWLNSIELVVEGVNDSVLLTYSNVFTGFGFAPLETLVLDIPFGWFANPVFATTIGNLLNFMFGIVLFATPNLPLWLALPISFAIWGFIIGLFKWVLDTFLFFFTD